MAAVSESGTHSFDGGSDSPWMKELITPSCQYFLIEELLERILEQYIILFRLWNYFHSLAGREELWKDQLPTDGVAMQVGKGAWLCFFLLTWSLGRPMPETKLNSSALKGDEHHLILCLKLPEPEFMCMCLATYHSCNSVSFFLSIWNNTNLLSDESSSLHKETLLSREEYKKQALMSSFTSFPEFVSVFGVN